MIQFFLTSLLMVLLVPEMAGALSPLTCAQVNLRKVQEGAGCVTSKGHGFNLVYRASTGKEAWVDIGTGIIWTDKLSERIRRRAAADLCKKNIPDENSFKDLHASELPTLKDFEAAEAHGFREVLPNMKDHFYWVDSTVPGAKNIGHVFNGNLGKPEIVVYRSINFENVRCIQRTLPKK